MSDRLSLVAVLTVIGAIWLAVGPDEMAIDRTCTTYSSATQCRRF